MSRLAAVHAGQLDAVALVVAVEGRLGVLPPPPAAEGRGDVPAGAQLAQEQPGQPRAQRHLHHTRRVKIFDTFAKIFGAPGPGPGRS